MTVESITSKISEHTGVPASDILSKKKDKNTCMAKKMFMYILSRRCNQPVKDIASLLGCSHQNVSCQLTTFDQERRVYKIVNCQLKEIENALFIPTE